MASSSQLAFLLAMYKSAQRAAAVYTPWTLGIKPKQYAACAAAEASEETGWGVDLPPYSENVLGIKVFDGWKGRSVAADGTEQGKDGSWTGPQHDLWCAFANTDDCFKQQLMILQESRYAVVRQATKPEDYIIRECAIWSTGLQKGSTVTTIYHSHLDILSS